MSSTNVINELKEKRDFIKAKNYARFFKTGKGEYGEGDIFWGIVVPEQRKIAKKFVGLPLVEVQKLLSSPVHEHRLTALFILVCKLKTATVDEGEREKIYKLYLRNARKINNWDLVDSSAPYIVGEYLLKFSKFSELAKLSKLTELAKSNNLWERRIAVLATFAFIKNQNTPSPIRGGIKGGVLVRDDFNTPASILPLNGGGRRTRKDKKFTCALKIIKLLLDDDHDLIHKAVGWMLREIGKRDLSVEKNFLDKYHKIMPRTMLRYAIEKFNKKDRVYFLTK